MRETNYWLKVTHRTLLNSKKENELLELLDESKQLNKILGSVRKTASEKK